MSRVIPLRSDDFYHRRAEELYLEGVRYVSENRDHKAALHCFLEAHRFDKYVPNYVFYIGVSYFLLDETQKAEKALKKACEMDETNHEYTYTHAKALYRCKRYKDAEDKFITILEKTTHYPECYFYLGKIYGLRLETHPQAFECYDSLLKREPHRVDVLVEKGVLYSHTHDYEQAEIMFLKSISTNKTYPFAYYFLQKIYLKKGEFQRAISILETLKETCPDQTELVDANIRVIQDLKRV